MFYFAKAEFPEEIGFIGERENFFCPQFLCFFNAGVYQLPADIFTLPFLFHGKRFYFRGTDAKDRMVVLQFQPLPDPAKEKKAEKETAPPSYLRLAYIEKPKNPDVFQIKPGQF